MIFPGFFGALGSLVVVSVFISAACLRDKRVQDEFFIVYEENHRTALSFSRAF
jgi:hypothetical protein